MTFSAYLRSSVGLTALALFFFCTNANAQNDMRILYNIDTGNVQIEIINPVSQLLSIETSGPSVAPGSGFLLFNNVDSSTVLGTPFPLPPPDQDSIVFLDATGLFPVGIVDIGNILPPDITFVSTDATNTLSTGTDAAGNSVGFGALSYTVNPTAGNPGGTFQVAITTVMDVVCGDIDLNGEVNFLDIAPFIALLSSSGFQAEADCNQSGGVDFLDIGPFIAALTGN